MSELEQDALSALYRTLVENARDVITLVDDRGVVKFQSPSVEIHFGYTPEELLGINIFELVHEDDVELAVETLHSIAAGVEDVPPALMRFLHKDQRWRYVEVVGQALDGDISGIVLNTREITEQQETLIALRKSEESFQAAFNATSTINTISIPETGEFINVNEAWVNTMGWSRDEAIGKSALELNIWGTRKNRDDFINAFQDQGKLRQFETELCTKSGERRNFLVDAEILRLQENPRMFLSGTDITARKRMEKQLRESEGRYRDLVEYIPDVVWRMNLEGVHTYLSQRIKSMAGYDPDELIGLSFEEFRKKLLVADSDDRAREGFAQRLQGAKQEMIYELTCKRKDGSEFTAELHSVPVLNEYGEVVELAGTIRDISERRLALDKLNSALADSRRAARLVKLGTYEWDWVENRFAACSEECARMLGMSIAEAFTNTAGIDTVDAFLHPDDQETYRTIRAEAMTSGGGFTASYRVLLPGGRIRHVREVCEFELDNQGRVIRSLGTLQDVSEQVDLEGQLRQAQKMEAVGQLTGGVAHDFNNLLAIISINLELAMESDTENEKLAVLNQAMTAVDRASNLTSQLLTFSRQQHLNPKSGNINVVIADTIDLLTRTLGEDVEIKTDFAEELPLINVDSVILQNAILNMANNARDAMPNGGILSIDTSMVELDEEFLQELGIVATGSYVLMRITDSGSGMDAKTRSHVFEPFFTTKDVGEGTGLGLSMVYGFVKQSGGYITVSSKEGQGSVFSLYFPVHHEHHKDVESGFSSITRTNTKKTILVVEDDKGLRKVTASMLTQLGFIVLEAEDGASALEALKTHYEQVDLVFTDVILPRGVTGVDLANILRTRYPEIKILLTSGYSNRMIEKREIDGAGFAMIRKPYKKIDLAEALDITFS